MDEEIAKRPVGTRATYKWSRGAKTVYNHYDNFPTGARRFLMGTRTAEDFLERNPTAEITESHEVHGDTEWRYTITPLVYYPTGGDDIDLLIERFQHKDGSSDKDRWVAVYDDKLYKFLEWDGVAGAIELGEEMPSIPIIPNKLVGLSSAKKLRGVTF